MHALKLEGAPCDGDFGQHEVAIRVAEMMAQGCLVFRIGEIDRVLQVAPGGKSGNVPSVRGVRRLLAGHGGPPLAGEGMNRVGLERFSVDAFVRPGV